MKNLVQGSPEWHLFRQNHIGASDSAAILGISPWKTSIQLLEEKVFGWEEPMNNHMKRGNKLEPLARQAFEIETGWHFSPVVIESGNYPFLAASLDGMSEDGKRVVEIKCGKSSHKLAQLGIIPPYYYSQLQHQMYVAEVEEIFYYSFDGKSGIKITISFDPEYVEVMLEKEIQFWNCISNFHTPEVRYEAIRVI